MNRTPRRLAVFIDGKSFALGLHHVDPRARVDFGRLGAWLLRQAGASHLAGMTYYTGVEEPPVPGLDRFLTWLDCQPAVTVRRFPRVSRRAPCSSCRATTTFTQEKGVDTTIAVDLVRGALRREFEVAVLVGGDRDHLPSVQVVGGMGIPVFVASWGGYGMSSALRAAADGHVDLSGILRSLRRGTTAKMPVGTGRPRPNRHPPCGSAASRH